LLGELFLLLVSATSSSLLLWAEFPDNLDTSAGSGGILCWFIILIILLHEFFCLLNEGTMLFISIVLHTGFTLTLKLHHLLLNVIIIILFLLISYYLGWGTFWFIVLSDDITRLCGLLFLLLSTCLLFLGLSLSCSLSFLPLSVLFFLLAPPSHLFLLLLIISSPRSLLFLYRLLFSLLLFSL
jgi:hypothetical protein